MTEKTTKIISQANRSLARDLIRDLPNTKQEC